MSPYSRIRVELMIALVLLGLSDLVHAQRPVAPRPSAPPVGPRPTLRSAPRNPRELLPLERQFLELEVDLGQPAPFPTRTPVAVPPATQAPIPREVARQAPAASPVAPAATSIVLGPVNWRRDFESAKRRPIETVVFGKGPKRIAVLSSLTGNSEPTVALVERLAGVFSRDGLMPIQMSVLVVRSPNPDGQADRTLTNSRGVDLNRNFPNTRFTASPRRETGEKPGSEPETRALVQLLNQFNPELVIHVIESRSSRGTVRSDDHIPRELLPQFDSAPFDHVYKTGSLAGYVHETMKCSVVEIELPTESTATTDENSLLQLMVSTLDQSVRSLRTQLAARNTLAEQIPSTTLETSRARPDGLGGIVEFLPPPPDSGPETPRKRFIELPPPPNQ